MQSKDRPAYLLGLDIGSASLGWALLEAERSEDGDRWIPTRVERLGVRVFPAGMTGDFDRGREKPPAADRRAARQARRLLARRSSRLDRVWGTLASAGFLPPAQSRWERHQVLIQLDRELAGEESALCPDGDVGLLPYRLRALALDVPLSAFAVGRTLFHLAQRRGFQSNRKAPIRDDAQEGVVGEGIKSLRQAMQDSGARTLGEYLARLAGAGGRVRGRYTDRKMYTEEFDRIWDSQRRFHCPLEDEAYREAVRKAIFRQRPLRSPRPGKCQLERRRSRAPKALLIAQRFLLVQAVNNLRVVESDGSPRPLTETERQRVLDILGKDGDTTLRALRKALRLEATQFTMELGGEKKIRGDRTSAAIRKAIGAAWDRLDEASRARLVDDMRSIGNPEAFKRRAQVHWELSAEQAEKLVSVKLEPGYLSFSKTALLRLVPRLELGEDVETAIRNEYPDSRRVTAYPTLPPLRGHFDDLTNPAVRRSLSQVRQVLNAIIGRYGTPAEVHIELSRDLRRSRKERERLSARMRERERIRERTARLILEECGFAPSARDVEKALLFEECGEQCPYTGRTISFCSLFGPAPEFDIEHIIPFSRSLDDSLANKTLCWAEENRNVKRGRSPREAYSASEVRWAEIVQRVQRFSGSDKSEKLRRFLMSADEEREYFGEFGARRLNDTRFSSKAAIRYLALLYGGSVDGVDPQGRRRIFASAGGVSAHVRRALGLERLLGGTKNRADHRHHAVDALAIALTSPATVQRLAKEAKQREQGGPGRPYSQIDPPWPGLLEEASRLLDDLVVSHLARRGVSGGFHKETFYSEPRPHPESGDLVVHYRKPLSSLTREMVSRIVDPRIKAIVQASLGDGDPKVVFQQDSALPMLPNRNGTPVPIRKVRIWDRLAVERLGEPERARWVTTGDNHHIEVFAAPRGPDRVEWRGRIVTRLEANRRRARKHPIVDRDGSEFGVGARFLFSLAPGEMFLLESTGCFYLVLSTSVTAAGQFDIEYVLHSDARLRQERQQLGERLRGGLASLQKAGFRKVQVTPLGDWRNCND